eukprot:comp18095_c0_seq1/m.18730 comp18095_c0_seq1/g.18730  ORF comp18095_c0_seq1/g.18730 comp18095_c0_seq1/m.18730 type:complete len:472 (-) comp18095_c0_seq1:684-2099(-)
MASLNVVVRWAKHSFELQINPRQDLRVFRQQVHKATGVNPSRQKLLFHGRVIKDDTNLQSLGLKEGSTILLMGSVEDLDEPGPSERPRFVEDMTEEERREELRQFMAAREDMRDEDRYVAEHFISSFPGMPDFVPYDFSYRYGQVRDEVRFKTDLGNGNMEALHLRTLALRLQTAVLSDDTATAKRLALGHYSKHSSPLALAASGILSTLQNPLLIAVQRGNLELVKYFITEGGIPVNSTTHAGGGQSPLHLAVANNDEAMVELLVANGARVDTRGAFTRRTPLHYACQMGNINVARFLFSRVQGRIKDLFGEHDRNEWMGLAISRDHVEILQLLVDKKYVRLTEWTDPQTHLGPLHVACKCGSLRVATYLLDDQYMEVDAVAANGSTPLSLAIRYGGLEMVELLLRKGAKRIEALAQPGLTAELHACLVEVGMEVPSLKHMCVVTLKHKQWHGRRQAIYKLPGGLIELFD